MKSLIFLKIEFHCFESGYRKFLDMFEDSIDKVEIEHILYVNLNNKN